MSSESDAPLYLRYQPEQTSRIREEIEWSITYTYNALDADAPRLLLIGDSICNAYQSAVREKLGNLMNTSFWASSKCVTDPDYFRELDLILSGYRYDVISFNNGLHSLTTDFAEWTNAYRSAVAFIREKCPDSRLFLTNCTPLRDSEKTARAVDLNRVIEETAKAMQLSVIDLFSLMNPLDRDKFWGDPYHFLPEAIELQAELIAGTVGILPEVVAFRKTVVQHGTETGPSGALK